MIEPKSVIEILKYLPKTNCRECGEATCMAFAANVFTGQKVLGDCPYVGSEVLERFGNAVQDFKPGQENQLEALNQLKKRLQATDLSSAAKRVGAAYNNGKLTLKVCGKDFSVDSEGKFYADIHVHAWLTLPALNYILDGKGGAPLGQWVPFRELEGGKDWARFFEHRCEKPMKKVADSYPDFFSDLLHLFAGKQVKKHYDSDISLVLHPLPKVPVLICYWKPEDGLASDLHLFLDATADKNLSIDSIYTLMTGLTVMFERIALRHA